MKIVAYRVINEDNKEYELFGEFDTAMKRKRKLEGRGVPTRLERKEVEFNNEQWVIIS